MRKKKIKLRKTWGALRPVQKVKPSGKIYSRQKQKNVDK